MRTRDSVAMFLTVATLLTITAAAPPPTAAGPAQEDARHHTVRGTLEAVNLERMEIVVDNDSAGTLSLVLTPETTIQGPRGPLTLADLEGKAGSGVTVSYVDDGSVLRALVVELTS